MSLVARQSRVAAASLGALLALAALGCGGDRDALTGRARASILGGALAPHDTAVVAIGNFAGGNCSGSLISPRLVLSARHCVADTAGRDVQVLCGQTEFEDPDSPGAVFEVAGPEITDRTEDYLPLSAIILPEGVDGDLCGTDEALLVLKEPLTGVTALEPRLEQAVDVGERYSAVGYGVDETDSERLAGVRKRLDDLEVACSGEGCGVADVRDNEWVGSGGPCSGDSGGPALDEQGRVIGVVSRGKDGCAEPVFGDIASRAEWLKLEAIRAANATREKPPAWAPCDAPEPCTYDDTSADDASCSLGRRPTAGWPAALLGWGLVGAARARRRRPGIVKIAPRRG
jgi:V8-like Glu-specific endopeptidase